MKKFTLIALMLVSTLSFAHSKTEADQRKMYNTIQAQLDEGTIDIKTAQKMWKAYIGCCKK